MVHDGYLSISNYLSSGIIRFNNSKRWGSGIVSEIIQEKIRMKAIKYEKMWFGMVDGNLSKEILFILLSNVWFEREVG